MYPPIKPQVLSQYSVICKTALVTPASGERLAVSEIEVMNRSGSAIDLAYGALLPNASWEAGQWDDSATGVEFIDDTTDAQDAGADDFALATASTNNDGFVIAATKKFSLVGLTIGVTQAGAPTYEYTYWNGSAWTTLTLIDTPVYTGAADTYLTFLPPLDWATGAGSGIGASHYAVRMRATTAPTTAPLASIAWVARFMDFAEAVADNNSLLWTAPRFTEDLELTGGESIVPYFGSANAANAVRCRYRLLGEFAS